MVEEKESDDSDEENNFTEKIQDTNNTDLEEDIIYQLSKSEEKELKKFRKVDYSWIAALWALEDGGGFCTLFSRFDLFSLCVDTPQIYLNVFSVLEMLNINRLYF